MTLAVRVAATLVVTSLLLCVSALAQPGGTQVKGTLQSIADNTVTLTDGSSFPLAEQPRVTQMWPATPADLAPGQFLQISARRLADGTLDASVIGVFPPGSAPGAGQRELTEFRFSEPGCEAGDLMTNAAIEDARVDTVGEGELSISFLDQRQTVRITRATRIDIQALGSVDDLVPGATVIGFVNPQGVAATVWVYMS